MFSSKQSSSHLWVCKQVASFLNCIKVTSLSFPGETEGRRLIREKCFALSHISNCMDVGRCACVSVCARVCLQSANVAAQRVRGCKNRLFVHNFKTMTGLSTCIKRRWSGRQENIQQTPGKSFFEKRRSGWLGGNLGGQAVQISSGVLELLEESTAQLLCAPVCTLEKFYCEILSINPNITRNAINRSAQGLREHSCSFQLETKNAHFKMLKLHLMNLPQKSQLD